MMRPLPVSGRRASAMVNLLVFGDTERAPHRFRPIARQGTLPNCLQGIASSLWPSAPERGAAPASCEEAGEGADSDHG
jgi:hypothetical protein